MNQRLFYFLFFLFSCTSYAFCQVDYKPAKIIPPSPTAAALGTYGDLQVGGYTGIPSINIPIYAIKTKDHSLDIRLNYNAGGIRVSEDASWVGLGWSLFAGGIITRTIRGKDDFEAHGYFYAQSAPQSETGEYTDLDFTNRPNDKFFFDQVRENALDAEPDVFSYNFGEYSGKFIIGKSINGAKVFMDEQNNLKVEYIPYYSGDPVNSDKWIITDAKGYKYVFLTKESSIGYSYSSTSNHILNKTGLTQFVSSNENPVSSWYLDSITSPNQEAINFEYSIGDSWSLSAIGFSEQRYDLLQLIGGTCGNTPTFQVYYDFYNASRQLIKDVRLKKITFNSGTVEFYASDRDDLEYITDFGGGKPKKLSYIIVKNLSGKELKRVNLNYTYFNQQNLDGKRLKLDEVNESVSIAPLLKGQSYKLNYYDPESLPDKTSFSVDHWGFYNVSANSSLLPGIFVPGHNKNYDGANRFPSQDLGTVRPGSLSSIQYPTGGLTSFEYELNEFKDDRGAFFEYRPVSYYLTSSPGQQNPTAVNFSVEEEKTAVVSVSYYHENQNDNSWVDYAYITKNGQFYASYNNKGVNSIEGEDSNLTLSPGNYVLHVNQYSDRYASISVSWRDKVILTQLKGGGLRIKSIKNTDGTSVTSVKKFLYHNNNRSTGKLIIYPKYDYSFIVDEPQGDWCAISASYLSRMSNSVYAPGLSSANTVAYDMVTELSGENGEGGKKIYYYKNASAYVENVPLPVQINPLNGKLDSTVIYSASGKRINKSTYSYNLKSRESIQGVKMFGTSLGSSYTPVYSIYYYDNPSTWTVLSSKKEFSYTDHGEVVSIEKNYYDDAEHKLITSQVKQKSSGDSVLTKFKYTKDFNLMEPYHTMYERHIWEPVIETSQYLNNLNRFLQSNLTNYKDWGNNIIAPVDERITVGTKSSINIIYDRYDDKGNLLSLYNDKGPKTSYIYSYGNILPVAEIKNSSYNVIESTIGSSVLQGFRNNPSPSDDEVRSFINVLRNHPNFRDSQVTTFTYSPLIGMTSTTDAKGQVSYYVYDNFQRLKLIKDQNDNIIKSYDYYYRP